MSRRADHEILNAYLDLFGNLPPMAGLTSAQLDRAYELLEVAIERGRAFDDQAEWHALLGVEPPPEGALTSSPPRHGGGST